MKNRIFKEEFGRRSEKGLSAIELLIAMAIFLIVMSSVYGVLKIGNISRSTINSRSENIKNVRMALNSIGREAVNAGLGYNRIGSTVPDDFTTGNFNLPADPDSDYDLLTAISTGSNINESTIAKNGEKTDVIAFAFRDFEFNDGFPIVMNDVTKKDTSLVLKTPDGACANCRPYDLFLIESEEGRQALILATNIVNENSIVLGENDPLNINYGKAVSAASPTPTSGSSGDDGSSGLCLLIICIGGSSGSSDNTERSILKKCKSSTDTNCFNYGTTTVVAKKIYLVSYSVSADGTLIRTTFGNNTGAGADEQIQRQPIAFGVRSLQIKYLLSDGTVTEDPSEANIKKERCNDIVQVEVSITVESETNRSGVNTPETMTLSSTFSTRNLKYDNY